MGKRVSLYEDSSGSFVAEIRKNGELVSVGSGSSRTDALKSARRGMSESSSGQSIFQKTGQFISNHPIASAAGAMIALRGIEDGNRVSDSLVAGGITTAGIVGAGFAAKTTAKVAMATAPLIALGAIGNGVKDFLMLVLEENSKKEPKKEKRSRAGSFEKGIHIEVGDRGAGNYEAEIYKDNRLICYGNGDTKQEALAQAKEKMHCGDYLKNGPRRHFLFAHED